MGAGDGQDVTAAQHVLVEESGRRGVRNLVLQQIFHRRIAPRQRVTDDNAIRRGLKLFGLVTGDHFDTLLPEEIAHGRIGLGVRTRHAVAETAGEQRESPHERAADAEKMKMHDCCAFPLTRPPSCPSKTDC